MRPEAILVVDDEEVMRDVLQTLLEQGGYEVAVCQNAEEALALAGLEGEVASAGIGVSHRGVPVPVWVKDGGDGRFGPGDHLEMVGERLAGDRGWFHPFSDRNVYRLDLDLTEPARMAAAAGCEGGGGELSARLHLERDALRARFDGGTEPSIEEAAEEDLALVDRELGERLAQIRNARRGIRDGHLVVSQVDHHRGAEHSPMSTGRPIVGHAHLNEGTSAASGRRHRASVTR